MRRWGPVPLSVMIAVAWRVVSAEVAPTAASWAMAGRAAAAAEAPAAAAEAAGMGRAASSGGILGGDGSPGDGQGGCVAPDMLIVLDHTDSMSDEPTGKKPPNTMAGHMLSKWYLATQAIKAVVAPPGDTKIDFGLELFPLDPKTMTDAGGTGSCMTLSQLLAGWPRPTRTARQPRCLSRRRRHRDRHHQPARSRDAAPLRVHAHRAGPRHRAGRARGRQSTACRSTYCSSPTAARRARATLWASRSSWRPRASRRSSSASAASRRSRRRQRPAARRHGVRRRDVSRLPRRVHQGRQRLHRDQHERRAPLLLRRGRRLAAERAAGHHQERVLRVRPVAGARSRRRET